MKRISFSAALLTLLCGLFLFGCGSKKPTLKVAATAVPHAEILERAKPKLAAQGIELEILVVDDFHLPNRALAEREVDADFFQHMPFLEAEKASFGYHLVSLGPVHIEPMGLYSSRWEDLSALPSCAKVGVPSDPSNQARALLLLQSAGLLELKADVEPARAGVLDIQSNPRQLQFFEVDSSLLARALDDLDLAALSTNFALVGGIADKALLHEGAESPYANLLVVRTGEEGKEELQALYRELTSAEMGAFIESRYSGLVKPAFPASPNR